MPIDDHDVLGRADRGGVGGGPDPARAQGPGEHVGRAGLVEGHLAGVDGRDRPLVEVVERHPQPTLGEGQTERQADVAAAADDHDIERTAQWTTLFTRRPAVEQRHVSAGSTGLYSAASRVRHQPTVRRHVGALWWPAGRGNPVTDPDADAADAGINYQRLYAYRFRDVEQSARQAVWDEIAPWLHRALGAPQRVLDPAAGRGEFIRAVPAAERWAIDLVDHAGEGWSPDIRRTVGDARRCDLPDRYFDGILVSNLLEHFESQDEIGGFLGTMFRCLRPGGRIAVMGPNFRYCAEDYFDCADHTIALTHLSVEEHLYAAGFEIERVIPRFLPFSFRSRTPRSPRLVRAYLGFPPAWRLLGRQFLLIGRVSPPDDMTRGDGDGAGSSIGGAR